MTLYFDHHIDDQIYSAAMETQRQEKMKEAHKKMQEELHSVERRKTRMEERLVYMGYYVPIHMKSFNRYF